MSLPLSPPLQLSHVNSRSRSRFSSAAVTDSHYADYFLGPAPTHNDRQEARRRLGRSGRVVHDIGSSSDSDTASDLDAQQLAVEGIRRVTFSTGGGPEQPQHEWQADQALTPHPPPPQAARLWRGAAASICAGQRVQSLERHAAGLKQRQEVHTELKAWVDHVLSLQHQDVPVITADDDALDHDWDRTTDSCSHDSSQQLHHTRHHHQHHQHTGQQQQQGSQQQPRKSHQKHHHRHHRQHHDSQEARDAATVAQCSEHCAGAGQQEPEAETVQTEGAGGVLQATDSTPVAAAAAGQEGLQPDPPLLVPMQQNAEQWQQFNAAEQQLIQQLQQDQEMLLAQLQQAYQQISTLTAAVLLHTEAANAGYVETADAHADRFLSYGVTPVGSQPGPVTHQVLLVTEGDNTPDEDRAQLLDGTQQGQYLLQQQEPAEPPATEHQQPSSAVRSSSESAAAARSSNNSSNSPCPSLANKAAAAAQPGKSPRAAGGLRPQPAQRARTAATAVAGAVPSSPRKSPRQLGKTAGRSSPAVPQKPLTLQQQQALVERLRQAEEVMDLLQQDLQASIEAQQLLQQQLCQVQEGHTATGQPPGDAQEERQQQEQCCLDDAAAATANDGDQPPPHLEQALQKDESVQCVGVSSDTDLRSGLQELQEQLAQASTAHQQLAEALAAAAAQQQQVAELQDQLQNHQQQEQQYLQQIQALQQQLLEQGTLQPANTKHAEQEEEEVLNFRSLEVAAVTSHGPVCCQHEARCHQLQSVLHALLQQLDATSTAAAAGYSFGRPHTAADELSPRACRAVWHHRPLAMHTWMVPPVHCSLHRPATVATRLQPPQTSGAQQAGCTLGSSTQPQGQQCDRAAALSPGSAASSRRCNTNGPLTTRCGSAAPLGQQLQDDNTSWQSGACTARLRPLTYRGADSSTGLEATGSVSSRCRLSADAERGLLSSLRVASCKAGSSSRGCQGLQRQALDGTGSADEGCEVSQTTSPRRSPQRNRATGIVRSASAATAGGHAWAAATDLGDRSVVASPRPIKGQADQKCAGRVVPKLMLPG